MIDTIIQGHPTLMRLREMSISMGVYSWFVEGAILLSFIWIIYYIYKTINSKEANNVKI